MDWELANNPTYPIHVYEIKGTLFGSQESDQFGV